LPAPSTAGAEGPPLDAAALKKVKAATVYLQVKLLDGRVIQGSGFFTDEPGLVATNAHVLDMLDADSRKPRGVGVTVHDGMGKARTLAGKVVGVDRGSDLGLIRVADKDLPEPLKLGTARGLTETDTVYVFGFPFGKDLGKEVTVHKSTVSSLRQSAAGTLQRVQLDGGLNPGNSGGPVVDGRGKVVGVAVSAVRNARIGFAIPAEHLVTFLNGRIIGSSVGTPYLDGAGSKLPITFELVDPLGRLKMVDTEIWAGNPGRPRPPGATEPAPLPGDSPKKRYSMKYDKTPTVTLDVPAPPLGGPRQVYWIRPVITNGLNETRWVMATSAPARPPLARKPITLKYRPPVGGKQTAELVSIGGFRTRDRSGEENALSMILRTSFTEHFGEAEPQHFPMRLAYDRFTLTIRIDDKPLADIRFLSTHVEMDRDGSVSGAKAELARVPRASRAGLSDISDQVLQSLEALCVPLPEKKVEALETWKAQRNFMIGSGIIAVPAQADIVYKYLGVQRRDGRDVAVIAIEGKVKGRRGDGLNAGGTVSGTAYVSTETGEVVQANATVRADVDVVLARQPAKAMGTLSVSITRPAAPPTKK
jgi:S1-C subfamily serine protease